MVEHIMTISWIRQLIHDRKHICVIYTVLDELTIYLLDATVFIDISF